MKTNIIHNIGVILTVLIAIIGGVLAYADRVAALAAISPQFAHYWPFCLAACAALLPILQYVQKQISDIKIIAFLAIGVFAFSLSACSTARPTDTKSASVNASNAQKNARGAAVNEALNEAKKVLGDTAVSEIESATQSYVENNGKVTGPELLSSAIYSAAASSFKDFSISKIASAYKVANVTSLANASDKAIVNSTASPTVSMNAVATVISSQLGAPPANPAKTIGL